MSVIISKICQYKTNDFYIKTLKNFCIQYWFGFAEKLVSQGNWLRRETGFKGKLASKGNWLRRETGFEGKLASQGNWLHRETGFAGKMALQENLFFVTLAKMFIIILVVKQITYNAKVSNIAIL